MRVEPQVSHEVEEGTVTSKVKQNRALSQTDLAVALRWAQLLQLPECPKIQIPPHSPLTHQLSG